MVTKKNLTEDAVSLETAGTPDLSVVGLPERGDKFPIPMLPATYNNPAAKYESIKEALSAPFPQELVSYREGAWNNETKQRDQLRYVNVNHYEDRLNAVAFGHWESSKPEVLLAEEWADEMVYNPQTKKKEKTGNKFLEHGYVVSLTVTVYGITHGGMSDFDVKSTGAYAAAFKRACLKHGLGRELYEKETSDSPLATSSNGYNATPSGSTRQSAPATSTTSGKTSDGGYPRPTEGQRGFLVKLGVPQSLIDQNDGNGNYTITGNIGRDLIDNLKDGGVSVADALAKHGINLPATSQRSDGLPVRTGYRTR